MQVLSHGAPSAQKLSRPDVVDLTWDVDPPSTRWARDELWIVSQPTYNEKIS